jgi:hypothetical protein
MLLRLEYKQDLWEWIVKNHDNMIDQAENDNPILSKVLCFHPYKDNPDIGLSDKDQELLNRLKILEFMEKENSKSPTLPPKPTGTSFSNYKKPSMEIPPIDIDQSQY